MKTPFYDRHVSLGAKMIDFNGWEMPLHYPTGVVQEHQTVRNCCGLFDVSHMGRIDIVGPQAEELLQWLSTNQIAGHPDGSATYTTWCHEKGGTVDDLIVFRLHAQHFFIVTNASNREKDLAHIRAQAQGKNVEIKPAEAHMMILALQGPKSSLLLHELLPSLPDLAPMHLAQIDERHFQGIVSTTGYTGAGGFEIFSSVEHGLELWDTLLQFGHDIGLKPAGLGARDTLRLEMGYALYGHELSDSISPNESVSAWAVKLKDHPFIGKEAIALLDQAPKKRYACGVMLNEKAIPREGFKVFLDGQEIGVVTSGNFSPTLNRPIALVLANQELKPDQEVAIEIRSQQMKATVKKLPFIKSH